MRVLQILYSGLGGHGSVAFSLANAARSHGGWLNTFVFLGIEPTLPAYSASCAASNYPYTEVRTRPGAPVLAWPMLYRAIAQHRPDAIILHSVKAILPCMLYARCHGIPLVAVEHQPNALKSRAEWWVSRRLPDWADAIVVLTDEYRSTLRLTLGDRWCSRKVHLIPNGIDTCTFAPHSASTGDRGFTIGMAARMTSMKRQEILIDALALLRKDDSTPWLLSLAGDGETCDALRAHAKKRRVEDAVEFTGFLEEGELVEWFRRLDYYAHASSGETLSTSLLQALSMGLPIVGSDVPGISNLLSQGGGTGLIVSQDAESFSRAFLTLRNDLGMATALRNKARNLATSEFSNDAMFARYDQLITTLCCA